MSTEIKKEIALEIAHVLFIDIVGYSKLSINDQNAAVEELTQVVRGSEQFRKAEAAGRLLKIATGDGMALVFYTQSRSACAMRSRDQPRAQGVSAPATAHGHSQRAGQRCGRCKQSAICRSRPEHGATGDGLRRRRAHSSVPACGR